MEDFEKDDDFERNDRDEIFSKAVRAGKRTYFFDVKATRKNDYFLTITERKKRFEDDGNFRYEKHKIFLYKEDFEKFVDGLESSIDYIKSFGFDNDSISDVSKFTTSDDFTDD
jgi:hypothetical protein